MIRLPVNDPGKPDTRSATRLLVWVGRHQIGTLVLGIVFGVVWMVAQALMPFAIGRAIEEGIVERRLAGARVLVRDPARPRRRAGRCRRDAPPGRGLQLAAGVVPVRAVGGPPRRPIGPRGACAALDRGGRDDRLERRDARGRRVRHHRSPRRRGRRVRRGRGDPALGLGRARPARADRRADPRRHARSGDPAAPGATARAARAGRAADRARGGHGGGPARAARDRRRARVPSTATGHAPSRCGTRACAWPSHSRRSTRRRCCCPASSWSSSPG